MNRLICLFLFAFPYLSAAQELSAVRKNINQLSAPALWGRGYTKQGMARAADYLVTEFKKYGLQPLEGDNFRQSFSYPVNSFPGRMTLSLNGKKLTPGRDFVVKASSSGQKNVGVKLERRDSSTYVSTEKHIVLSMQHKLTWSVAAKAEDYTVLQLQDGELTSQPETIDLDIENLFIPAFKASNICGIIKGSRKPDSVLLITAHYDHLGGMGAATYFPGANDNASGIAMLLSLARYYIKNPPAYSIAFICFAGEEAGLLGSAYFTAHPLLSLSHIKFMVNLDMVGTGEQGITVVNATLHPEEFGMLRQINAQHKYLSTINSRGKAANSDHYYFTEKGVPAFFMYTQGGITAYHDVLDRSSTLPLTAFINLRKLLIDFTAQLTN